ncbi:hypothetical protein Emed_001775 [Eimeria media]
MEASLGEAHLARAYQESSNEEAVRRVMLLLSQSNIRQHLECQVRHYLSWKLLSRQKDEITHIGDWASVDTSEAAQQPTPGCLNSLHTSSKYRHSLVFKATVALILDWLKAHNLIHAAHVLCPEAALRETEVMSQRECLAVLSLPQCLLADQASTVSSTPQDSSLLGRLVSFAASGLATVPACGESHRSLNRRLSVHRRSSSAAKSAEESRTLGNPAFRRLMTADAASDMGHSRLRRSAKRFPRALAVTKKCGFYCRPRRRYVLTENTGGAYKMLGLDEGARTQLLLLAAKIRGLELHNSSGHLFAALDEVKQGVNRRLASIEAKHNYRIKRLQKEMKHGVSQSAYKPASKSGLQGNKDRLLQRCHVQNVAGATFANQPKYEMSGVAAAGGRGTPSAETLGELSTSARTNRYGLNRVLAKENANLRSQLLALTKHAALLQNQVLKYDNSYDEQPQLRINGNQAFEISLDPQKMRHKPSESPFALSDGGQQAASWAMKQEYEGRVAHLTEELQAKANQIQAKDADFRFLVGELEFARQKSAQVRRRARKLHKLYEAAKAAQAQQRRLAASVSLSLRTLALADVPSVELDGGEVFDTDSIVKASAKSNDADQAPDLNKISILKTSPDESLVTEPFLEEGARTQEDHRNPHTMRSGGDELQSAHDEVRQPKQQYRHQRELQPSSESLTACSAQVVHRADAKISLGETGSFTNTGQVGMGTRRRAPVYVKRPLTMTKASALDRSRPRISDGEAGPAADPSEVLHVDGSPVDFLSAPAHRLARAGASFVGRVMTTFEPALHWSHLEQALQGSQSSCVDSPGQNGMNNSSRRKVLEPVEAAILPVYCNTLHREIHGEALRRAPAEADSRAQLASPTGEEGSPRVSQDPPAVPRVKGPANHRLTGQEEAISAELQQSANLTTETNLFPRNDRRSSAQCTHELAVGTNVATVCQAFASPCAIAQPIEWRERRLASPDTPSAQRSSQDLAGPSACSRGDVESSQTFFGDIGAVPGNQPQHTVTAQAGASGAQASSASLADSRVMEGSVMSSQPETPKGLSNFPSLSCPVATPSPGHAADECLLRMGREHVVECRSPLSISPSESDWLACVSSSPKADIQVE